MMTRIYILMIGMFSSTFAFSQALKTAEDSMAYSLGILIGDNLQREGYQDLPMDILLAAIKASLTDEVALLSPEGCEQYVREASAQMKMKQYEANKMAGEEFLAKNKTRQGVVSLENGLQYEVMRAGDGVKPKATDEVIVHYHGTLPNGQIFDSSVDRGESISFPLNRVIKGWTEILQLMPVGSKWKVYIPYDMAYGDRAAGPYIQPYSALVFEIDLLGIK